METYYKKDDPLIVKADTDRNGLVVFDRDGLVVQVGGGHRIETKLDASEEERLLIYLLQRRIQNAKKNAIAQAGELSRLGWSSQHSLFEMDFAAPEDHPEWLWVDLTYLLSPKDGDSVEAV